MTYPKSLDYQHIAVAEFMLKANQTVSFIPIVPSLEVRKLRARLILEEALEVINGLGLCPFLKTGMGVVDISDIGFDAVIDSDLRLIADGCADLKVVTVGTEIACGINGKPIFEEVMRSNMTKLEGGSIREDGKILKGPKYEPPSIEPLLIEQGMQ